MKKGATSLFFVFSLLLAFGGCIAQIAYTFDKTLFSYTYMAGELEDVALLLHDPAIRKDTINGTFNDLQRIFYLDIPAKLEPFALKAAHEGFSHEWYVRTGKRLLFNTEATISRRAQDLSLPISIHEFKLALLDVARKEFSVYDYVDIDREVTAMPTTFDLVETVPQESLSRTNKILKLIEPLSVAARYALPGILLLLTFACLGIRRGLRAAGVGLFAAGILSVIWAIGPWDFAVRRIGRLAMSALPHHFSWAGSGIEDLVATLISGMVPQGVVFMMVGLGVYFLGFVLKKYRLPH